jgi:hypothetical protein
MLDYQTLPLAFSKGLQTKTDPKQIPAGELLVLQNGVFISPQEITKRNGFMSLSNTYVETTSPTFTGTITEGNSINTLAGNLALTDNFNIYGFSPDNHEWVLSGKLLNIGVSVTSLTNIVSTSFLPYELTVGDYKLVVYVTPATAITPSQISYQYQDPVTNTIIYTGELQALTNAFAQLGSLQIVEFNGQFVVTAYYNHAANSTWDISYFTLPLTPGTATIKAVISSNSNVADMIAPVTVSTPSAIYTLYYRTALPGIALTSFDTTFTQTGPVSVNTSVVATGLELLYDSVNSELVPIVSTTANTTSVFRFTLAMTFISNPANITNGGANFKNTGIILGANLAVYTEVTGGLSGGGGTDSNISVYINQSLVQAYRTAPSVANYGPFGYTNLIYARPFVLNNLVYLTTTHPVAVDPCNFVFQLDYSLPANQNYTVVAKFGLNTAYATSTLYATNTMPSTVPQGLATYNGLSLPYLFADETILLNGVITGVYVVKEVTLNFSTKNRSQELAKDLNLGGGSIRSYDGYETASCGFNVLPQITELAPQNGGAPNIYSYYAIFTWTDNAGNLYRSGRSAPQQQSSANPISSSSVMDVAVQGYSTDDYYKINNVQVQIYRTTPGGTVYYLIATLPNIPNGDIGFVDTTLDGSLILNQQLYTTGGEIDNSNCPAGSLLTSFKNRIIYINDEDRLQWWYSKQVIEGFPVEFNDSFTQNIDQKGGVMTAISTMDDKLILFKQSNIWYVYGDGPSPNALNNDFTYPQIISSDTGCVNQDSIILTPQGLMFQSPKGIYILGRDLSLSYLGSPVEQFNSIPVTSAQMIANTNQIRFTLNNGTAIVYDYFMNQWSIFTNVAAVDSCIYQGNHTYLTAAGIVNEETPGAYLDPGTTPIALSLTTGWLSFANIQGFQRVKKFLLLTEALANDTLQVQINYDYGKYSANLITIPVLGSTQPQQYRVFPQWQKMENMQIVLTEVPTTSSTTFKLSSMMLEVASKKGAFKLSAANSYG